MRYYLPRILCVLLVMTIASTICGSYTLSKFLATNDTDDASRVSSFGISVGVESNAFSRTYTSPDGTLTTVSSADTDNVLAPGTEGEFSGIHVTGSAEVAVLVNTTAEVSLNGWTLADGTFYCPLKITVNEVVYNGLDYDNKDAFVTDIQSAIATISEQIYEPGFDFSTVPELNCNYSWEWPFRQSTGSAINQSAENDTYLGDRSAAGSPSTFSITASVRAEQID